MNADAVKRVERDYWDGRRLAEPAAPVSVDGVRERVLRPCYDGGDDWYSDNKLAFHELLGGCWRGRYVLDYACGLGTWSIYYALTGARRVVGFDLSPASIERGRERVRAQHLEDRVQLAVMDASALEFPDGEFELVIGHGALHHVIKYPNIFEHLHRVMKPGAQAFFLEGLADFPLWKLWWRARGEVPDGDVPIFAREIREKAGMFADVEIIGDTFLYSLKRFVWKPRPGAVRRSVLRGLSSADRALFSAIPTLRRWGAFSYIRLTK